MQNENRNTLLLIIIVLIISIVALVAVLFVSWQLVGTSVTNVFNGVTRFIHLQNLDYNFQIPDFEEYAPSATVPSNGLVQLVDAAVLTDQEFNYNFAIPQRDDGETEYKIQDAILEDAHLALLNASDSDFSNTTFDIQVPSIGVSGPVYQGFDAATLLKKGFWLYPSSGKLGEGEMVILCHRRYFGPNDSRTCWYLDKSDIGDKVYVTVSGQTLEYEIKNQWVFDGEDPEIYNISQNNDALRIVTCTPLYSNTQRLVVYAERVG